MRSVRPLDKCLVRSVPRDSYHRTFLVKPVCAQLKRSDLVVPLAATMAAPGTFSVNGVLYCDSSYTDTRALVML